MRRLLLTLALFPVLVAPVFAQATAGSKIGFNQAAPDVATAQAFTYRAYADGATTGIVLTVTCTGAASPFTCSAPFPAFTPGAHSLQLTAANAAGESGKSSALAFTFVVIPSPPANLRIE